MGDNVLETIRATVQDILSPEIRAHGVRLDNIERRIDESRHILERQNADTKESLQRQNADTKESLQRQNVDTKETLRAEMRVLDARLDNIENLIRGLIQQISVESGLRERVASLEARMPKQ